MAAASWARSGWLARSAPSPLTATLLARPRLAFAIAPGDTCLAARCTFCVSSRAEQSRSSPDYAGPPSRTDARQALPRRQRRKAGRTTPLPKLLTAAGAARQLQTTAPGAPSEPPSSPQQGFRIRPYLQLARLDKPIGTWLLYWPCAWSITLAAHYTGAPLSVAATNILLFGTGAIVMRGAGCTINDMWDARMDRLVERTRSRPIASGEVTHFQALVFLGAQLSAGLAVLVNLNTYSILLGASSLAVVTVYPLMKRITYWPQFVLGLAFNWGALLGWSAVAGSCNWTVVLPMYAGSVAWTLVYDTIYAHQDKVDDVSAGVKSTALLFGEKTKPVLTAFSAMFLTGMAISAAAATPSLGSSWEVLTTPSLWLSSAVLAEHPAFIGALGTAAAHFAWQIRTVRLDSRPDCWRKFVSNKNIGLIIWLGLAADYGWYLYQSSEERPERPGAPMHVAE